MSSSSQPRLAEVRCSKIDFQPGDRILVQVYHRLDRDKHRRLEKMIREWAGEDVKILIVDRTQWELHIERTG